MQPLIFPIFLDYKCNYECKHCSVGSSPRTRMPVSEAHVYSFIDQVAQLPTARGVVFTGGEPTLRKALLLAAVRHAHDLGLLTRIVTNSWWAKTPVKAQRWVAAFREHGLDELNTSWDGFHGEFGELDHVANAVAAGLAAGMRVSVGVVEATMESTAKPALLEAVARRLEVTVAELGRRPLYVLVDHPAAVGAAGSLDLAEVAAGPRVDMGCNEIGSTVSLHPDGSVRGCCGHAVFYAPDLRLGRLDEEPLAQIVRKTQRNLAYWWIRSAGPVAILRVLGKPTAEYTHICHACQALLRDHRDEFVDYVRDHREEILAENVLSGKVVANPLRIAIRHKGELLGDRTSEDRTPDDRELPVSEHVVA